MIMKKIFIYFISFMFIAGVSCKDVLDQTSVDSFDEDVVFTDINLVKAYVGACYSMLGGKKMNGNAVNGPLIRRDFLSSSTDQTLNNFRAAGEVFLKGTMSPDKMDLFNNLDNGRPWLFWPNIYTNIQNLNKILSRIDEVPVNNTNEENLRTQLKGEAHFLRALSYSYLLMCYGGVVLTDKPFDIHDDFSTVKRSSIEDTKDFILNDVSKAIEFLPPTMEQGRATRAAAAAVKSRMLLFCSGKLTNGGWTEQATNELVSFPANSQRSLLEAARDAAKDIMDGKYGNFALVGNTSEPVLPLTDQQIQEYADSYFSIFHQPLGAAWNSETIWGTQFPEKDGRTYTPNMWCSPRGYDGASNNAPIEDAVRRFEMADGSKFVWDTDHPEDKLTMRRATAAQLETNPYLNPYYGREARFYASILYNGASWVERPTPVTKADPYNKIQFAYRFRKDKNTGKFPSTPSYNGVDTRQSTLNFNTGGNGTKTGYNLRKFLNPNIPGNATLGTNNTAWIEFRYAEVLLNYAEACIELGGSDLQKGIDAMNIVRHRAGLPSRVTTDQVKAREFVRHERDIELYGEGMRFFDIRRWMICDQVVANVYGMRINEYVSSNDDFDVLETTWQLTSIEDARKWGGNHFYWLPIMRSEINKSPGLVQNPGYE
jgi:hypothetical protein